MLGNLSNTAEWSTKFHSCAHNPGYSAWKSRTITKTSHLMLILILYYSYFDDSGLAFLKCNHFLRIYFSLHRCKFRCIPVVRYTCFMYPLQFLCHSFCYELKKGSQTQIFHCFHIYYILSVVFTNWHTKSAGNCN